MAVQLAGCEPRVMAEAAKLNADRGAQIIDINFGCPVKKVVNGHAGSALMRDELHAARILEATVKAVDLPVTLKMRTGWDEHSRNAPRLARIAQACGIRMITVHGRTRCQFYAGSSDWEFIRRVKEDVTIPVVANGDIDSPEKARMVLNYTGADAIMIGRAAQARPWIFREINHFLINGTKLAPASIAEMRPLLLRYLDEHYSHYGESIGARSARKRIHFLVRGLRSGTQLCERVNQTENCAEQRRALDEFLLEAAAHYPFFEYIDARQLASTAAHPHAYLHDSALSERQSNPLQLRPH